MTGAAGLIGRVTLKLLDAQGHEVLGTDLRPLPRGFQSLPWRELDVRHASNVRRTLESFAPEVVIHLAAKHFIPWCERHPAATLHTNVVGSQNIIEGARRAGVERLVLASSAAVYAPSAEPLHELAALGPDDIYGTSKLMCEQLLELAARAAEDGPSMVVLRLFNTIGPDDPNPHLVPRLISELARDSGPLRLGNLTTVRDYIYVEDVAWAFAAAVAAPLPGLTVLNVGSGSGHSVGELVEGLGRLLGRPLEAVSTAARRRTVDRPYLVCDPGLAQRTLGWRPRVSLAEGLERTLRAAGVQPAFTSAEAQIAVSVA